MSLKPEVNSLPWQEQKEDLDFEAGRSSLRSDLFRPSHALLPPVCDLHLPFHPGFKIASGRRRFFFFPAVYQMI